MTIWVFAVLESASGRHPICVYCLFPSARSNPKESTYFKPIHFRRGPGNKDTKTIQDTERFTMETWYKKWASRSAQAGIKFLREHLKAHVVQSHIPTTTRKLTFKILNLCIPLQTNAVCGAKRQGLFLRSFAESSYTTRMMGVTTGASHVLNLPKSCWNRQSSGRHTRTVKKQACSCSD